MCMRRFLHYHSNHLGELCLRSVAQLGLVQRRHILETVPASAPTIQAFATMASKQVSAIAVVDQHGRMISNLSASDFR